MAKPSIAFVCKEGQHGCLLFSTSTRSCCHILTPASVVVTSWGCVMKIPRRPSPAPSPVYCDRLGHESLRSALLSLTHEYRRLRYWLVLWRHFLRQSNYLLGQRSTLTFIPQTSHTATGGYHTSTIHTHIFEASLASLTEKLHFIAL